MEEKRLTGEKLYYTITYGCQMNESDTERIIGQLEELGYKPAENMEDADIVIMNTCSVRQNAEEKVYGKIGEIKKLKEKKNLFLLKVRSNLVGDYSHEFNLFCTDIERGFGEVSGGKVRAGSAVLDTLQQLEAGMVRITTFDDQSGTLKRWFLDHSAAQADRDGSFGVPADYAIEILLQHSFVGDSGGFTGKGWYRAQSCEVGLSRREDAMEELQMTFTQLDTFMR